MKRKESRLSSFLLPSETTEGSKNKRFFGCRCLGLLALTKSVVFVRMGSLVPAQNPPQNDERLNKPYYRHPEQSEGSN